jgi:sigma-B regulation protein RsbU (phosphoserine phosphatase)
VVTDGITDTAGPGGQPFGRERLLEVVQASRALSAEKIVQAVGQAAERFGEHRPQHDDVTALVLIRRPDSAGE